MAKNGFERSVLKAIFVLRGILVDGTFY